MSDGACIIVKVGGAGGSVTLLGQPMRGGEWRFALATVDNTAELLGGADVPSAETPALQWVDSLEEGLQLLDRYPWVRLHPVYVHPAFVERVRAAVEQRLANVGERSAERVRGNWGWRFEQALDGRERR